jgi:4-hydroxy-tetrahydrodipicolinate reductase
MKIALIGYGKMGKAIEEIAIERGHEIVLKINSSNLNDLNCENLQTAEVAIEFTNPESAPDNLKKCFDAFVPVVCGSTGWSKHQEAVMSSLEEKNGTLLTASNFSIGMNIFFEINRQLAGLMDARNEYEVSMEEIHHTQKKDAPSGTAITLAEDIVNQINRKGAWTSGPKHQPTDLNIISKRIDPAPGTHSVKYESTIDTIEIIHTAHNRRGFALGAVLAAEYIHNKKGLHHMSEVIRFSNQ